VKLEQGNVNKLFEKYPGALELYLSIQQFISSLGGITIETTKNQVSFGTKRKFAWIWLPQKWVRAPHDSVTLTFALHERLESPKIKEVVEPYPNRFTHHVVITSPGQFDDEVRSWLKDAYLLSKD
jgi:hypothetical protein